MKAGRRHPMVARAIASVAVLAVAAQGGGVSMCVSLLAEAATPCAILGPVSALISYLAPPLSPPPQA